MIKSHWLCTVPSQHIFFFNVFWSDKYSAIAVKFSATVQSRYKNLPFDEVFRYNCLLCSLHMPPLFSLWGVKLSGHPLPLAVGDLPRLRGAQSSPPKGGHDADAD